MISTGSVFFYCGKTGSSSEPQLGSKFVLFFLLFLSLAQMVKLQTCIKYCEESYSAAKVTSHNLMKHTY